MKVLKHIFICSILVFGLSIVASAQGGTQKPPKDPPAVDPGKKPQPTPQPTPPKKPGNVIELATKEIDQYLV